MDWIFDKQRRLDVEHEMVTDMPSWQNGRELQYGSLQGDARRWLKEAEIAWNDELISEEAAASSSAAATASGATQAAATASTLGEAGAQRGRRPQGATRESNGSCGQTVTQRQPSAAIDAIVAASPSQRPRPTIESLGCPAEVFDERNVVCPLLQPYSVAENGGCRKKLCETWRFLP